MEDFMDKLDKELNSREGAIASKIKKNLDGGFRHDKQQWRLALFIAASWQALQDDKGYLDSILSAYMDLMDIDVEPKIKEMMLVVNTTQPKSLMELIVLLKVVDRTIREFITFKKGKNDKA